MTIDLDTMLQDAAPRVTRDPDAYLAALAVSDEASRHTAPARSKRRVLATAGVVVVLVLGGTTAAAAATHSLWWAAPHVVVAEAQDVQGRSDVARTVAFVPSAEYRGDASASSAEARRAFQLAQQWLQDHPVAVAVPAGSQRLASHSDDRPDSVALEQQAIRATESVRASEISARGAGIRSDLGRYLESEGIDASIIVVDFEQGVFEVTP